MKCSQEKWNVYVIGNCSRKYSCTNFGIAFLWIEDFKNRIYLHLYVYIYINVLCMYVYLMCADACSGQKRWSNHLKLGLNMDLATKWVLGNKSDSVRAGSFLKYSNLSLILRFCFNKCLLEVLKHYMSSKISVYLLINWLIHHYAISINSKHTIPLF